MPRPENPVDPRAGPLSEFAHDLRSVRERFGNPSYRVLARRAGFSASTLSLAASGRVLPSLDVTLAYVQACGADPGEWRRRWLEVSSCLKRDPPQNAHPAPDTDPADHRADRDAGSPPDAADRAPVPRQLPRAVGRFTGRSRELDLLTRVLAGDQAAGAFAGICALVGPGGVGKTALAVQWAHQHTALFPDGQLFVDLRGYDPSDQPQTVAEALWGMLIALGTAPTAIPDGDAERGALYRSLTAERRALIVLDNALDSEQAVSLLPGGGRCAVLVTSRLRLEGLAVGSGAALVELGGLPDEDAGLLLARHAGTARLAREPEITAELLAACAGLPLALAVAAARIAGRPEFPLSELAEELRDETARLDVFDSADHAMSVRAVLSCSRRTLSDACAGAFGLLGLVPGTEIGLGAAAGLLGAPVRRTRAVLRDLETAHLLTQARPGRYRMHDLVRLYAAECAQHELPDDARDAAFARLLDHYLHTARSGEKALRPFSEDPPLPPPVAGSEPVALADPAASLDWFEAEHACLLALHRCLTARGADQATWQLAWALDTFHYRRAMRGESMEVWRAALDAARRAGDPQAQGLAHRHLGRALSGVGRHAEALRHLENALALAESTGDRAALAHTELNLGWARELAEDDRSALRHCLRALHEFRALGDSLREAVVLNAVGWYLTRLGRHAEAWRYCEAALELNSRHGNRAGQASTLDSLGQIAHNLRRYEQSAGYYRDTLAIYHELGNEYSESDTLVRLAEAYEACDRLDEAVQAWGLAYDLYRVQHRTPDADRARAALELVRAHLHARDLLAPGPRAEA